MLYIKRITALLTALAVSAALTACKNETEAPGSVESGELVVVEDNTEIGLGIYGIDTLNPLETASENVLAVMNIIYEPLFTYDAERRITGVLAADYSLSADGRQITVNLKEGIKWHDGTNFTADDVVYTLGKMRSSGGLYQKTAAKIRSFTAVNRQQAVINLENPEPDFAYLLTFPIISKNSPYRTDDSFVPMGTGSYKFAARTADTISLEPNTAWHGGAASKKSISVKILKTAEAAADAFNVNELDAVTSGELDIASSSPKINSQTKEIASDNMVFLGFNTARPTLAPANLRRAVSVIIDKQRLVDKDVYGYGIPADISINPSSWAYYGIEEDYPADYDEELISGLGYTADGGIYYKDGQPLSVKILVNSDNAGRVLLAESIAESLKASGFSVLVEKASYADYIARINSGDYDMFLGETECAANLNPAAMLTGETNYFGFDASGLKSALEALYGVSDKETYIEGVKTFVNIFNANPPYVPLFFKTESVIYGSYVSGIEQPVLHDPYKGIENWYFYNKNGNSE